MRIGNQSGLNGRAERPGGPAGRTGIEGRQLNEGALLSRPDDIQKHALGYLNDFLAALTGGNPPPLDLVFVSRRAGQPLQARVIHGRLTLHLNPHSLCGIPRLALKGWLELETALVWESQNPSRQGFNFSKTILPLFPVSGSAVQFIRRIVARLAIILIRVGATRFIIDEDRETIEALAALATSNCGADHASQVTALFQMIRPRLVA